MASLIGKEIGKYRITERLGQGGMAEVYAGVHTHLDRKVAVKVLHSYLLEGGDFVARFKREAKAVANLRHPNIVQVYDFDIQDQLIFMVMEYIDGVNLHTKLVEVGNRGERMPIKLIGSIINDIASALDYAHSKNMLHRDIKPSNIMIDSNNKAYLTDFGIAKLLSDQKFTATGTLVGTPAYMSPEQGLGDDVSKESDIYSLGVVAFEMLTGQVPYDAKTPIGIVHKQINDPVPDMRELVEGVPTTAQEVIDRALAKEPESRFSSAEDLVKALRTALSALESTEPISVPAEDTPTVIDDAFESPTVTMNAEELEQPTVVMKDKKPPEDKQPQKVTKSKPDKEPREKKKIPLWAYLAGAVGVAAIVSLILTQVLDLNLEGVSSTPFPVATAVPDVADGAPSGEGEELYNQALATYESGDDQTSIDLSYQAIDTGYETADVYNLIGRSYRRMGNMEAALEAYNQTIEMDPDHFWARYSRGRIRLDQGDPWGAIEDLTIATELDSGNASGWTYLGTALFYSGQEGNMELAQEALDRAIELEPENYQARLSRGELLWFHLRSEEALDDLTVAVENAPEDEFRHYSSRGIFFRETDQFQGCVDDLTAFIELSPDDPWGYWQRGECFLLLGEPDPARADYEVFVGMSEGNPDFDELRNEVEAWLEQ